MKVRVVGAHGGVTNKFRTTSFLIDGKLLIDAGSIASGTTLEEQTAVEHILISHAHLDHIKDLAFLCDNCFGLKSSPFEVYCHATVKTAIKHHLFNDLIWPDFSVIPSANQPTIRFNEIIPEKEFILGEYRIFPVSVNHPGDALGYVVSKGDVDLLFTCDTAKTDRIWEIAHQRPNLKAIFTEVSFPNHLQNVADLSYHHTPDTMKSEMKKMPEQAKVYLGHLKPNFQDQLIQEIRAINDPRIVIIDRVDLEVDVK